jgi:hypothetical protein
MAGIIIAGEDGVLYKIDDEQLKTFALDPHTEEAREARKLVEEGVSHAVFGPRTQKAAGHLYQVVHLLNLAAFRKPQAG